MLSPNPNPNFEQDKHLLLKPSREDMLIAFLAAFAIMIYIFEAALPSPFPGVKLGLANVITIATLLIYGWRVAAWVAILRVLVGSLMIGTFLSPTFAMSLAGATCSILMLGLSWKVCGRHLGPVGYGVLAALAHMGGQFMLAYTLFIPHVGLLKLLPVFMSLALVFGFVSGIIASAMIKRLS